MTTGRSNIFSQLEIVMKKLNLSINKLSGMATEGVVVMTAKNKGAISLCKQKIVEEKFSK